MHYVIRFERPDADVSGFLLFFFNYKTHTIKTFVEKNGQMKK